MSKSEDKEFLKRIRAAIKNGQYDDAIKCCTQILAYEPNSYIGNLLMGAAYQNISKIDAIFYLKRAYKSSTQPPTVALQGLANCVCDEELPNILGQLIDLVPGKQLEYLDKLYAISSNPTIALECFSILKQKLDSCPTQEEEITDKCSDTTESSSSATTEISSTPSNRKLLLKYLGKLWLLHEFDQQHSSNNLYKEALEVIILDRTSEMYVNAKKRYVKLLYNQREFKNCIRNAIDLIDVLPNDSYAYEWICKVYCENFQYPELYVLDDMEGFSIDTYINKFSEISQNSILLPFVKAIECYRSQQYAQTRANLYKTLNVIPKYREAILLLAQTETQMEAYTLAKGLWLQLGDDYIQDYAICLTHSTEVDDLKKALKIFQQKLKIDVNKSPPPSDTIIAALSRCYYKLDNEKQLQLLSPLMTTLCRAEFLLSPDKALEILLKENEDNNQSNLFPLLLLIGKLYFNAKDYASALVYILRATRLKPYSSECFYFLGCIYQINGDPERTRKCWEKCMNLNPLNMEALKRLSFMYQQAKEEETNAFMLQNTLKYLKSSTKSKEIHYRLGLHYANTNKWNEAIKSFRLAITQDVRYTIYWECLGDAYAERGSYNSALRVFQKILTMDPKNLYAKLQIAAMKSIMRMYVEAIEDYNLLLEEYPDYMPALKGGAEAHLGLVNCLKQDYRYGTARDHLQLAINLLQRCFLKKENLRMVWLWRLTASIFLLTARMPASMANLDVAGYLVKRDTEIAFLNRMDLLNLATRFYTCALIIKPNTYQWYELAVCYYYMADFNSEDITNSLDMAMNVCQMAIKEQSNRWQNWNLLAVINLHKHINNLPMAQHCLIQALNLDKRSYVAWTNLGVLYIKVNEINLANRAFQRAQQSLPIYPNAWIGQAMIAESMQENEEALDLFRHCQQFDFHAEAAIGYAHWVCLILTDPVKRRIPHYAHAIDVMHADVGAMDAINRYVINEEMNSGPAAFCFQGFLAERQRLYRPAIKAYNNAALTVTNPHDRDLIYTNLGFVYLKLKEPNEAISVFNKVVEASFKPISGLALAYFRAGQHREAYSLYNSILKNTTGNNPAKASAILAAMASMVYTFHGEAHTKTILYQCILLKDSPIQALLSACALGILHTHEELTQTILNELKKYENCEEHVAHVAYLTSQNYLMTGQQREAFLYILRRVHCFPHCTNLRKVFANFLLKNHKRDLTYKRAINQIALSAIHLMHGNERKRNNYTEDAESLLIASRALEMADKRAALKLMQRAIHLDPENKSAWKTLTEID